MIEDEVYCFLMNTPTEMSGNDGQRMDGSGLSGRKYQIYIGSHDVVMDDSRHIIMDSIMTRRLRRANDTGTSSHVGQ